MGKKQQYESPVLEELEIENFAVVMGQSKEDGVDDSGSDAGEP